MFWERFHALCKERKTSPTRVVNELGISQSSVTKWKNGAYPSSEALIKIAGKLDTTIDYLLGLSDQKEKTAPVGQSLTPMQAAALDMIVKLPDSALLNLMSFLDSLQGKQ